MRFLICAEAMKTYPTPSSPPYPNTPCPCFSETEYQYCCQPLLEKNMPAPTALALMRSRYTAHVLGYNTYLNTSEIKRSPSLPVHTISENLIWTHLEIIHVSRTLPPSHDKQSVEFKASYFDQSTRTHGVLHEKSSFKKKHGRWYYIRKS